MPPRKKSKNSSSSSASTPASSSSTSSSSKRNQPSQQPSKYGIQHFFHRQAQLSQSHPPNPNTPNSPNLPNLPNSAPNVDDSPEFPKFSPGMLIKQSQEDGCDDMISWKISPVNQRLQKAVSNQLPPPRPSFSIRPCSLNNQTSPPKSRVPAFQNPLLVSAPTVGPERIKSFQDTAVPRTLSLPGPQSPFRTPPSLSCFHSKQKLPNVAECNGASDKVGTWQHKQAFLELLDQVKDAICEEETVLSETNPSKVQCQSGSEMPCKSDFPVKRAPKDGPETVCRPLSNHNFLVLEVSEKQKPSDSSSARCLYKVLRVLNEQSGEERAVHLWEEWFYSVIYPGDTVNVIGEFDEHGKCNVDHDNNLLVVHPDILVSGTRVAASFSCPRRTVLDERLKCSEHSKAALIGTLLHQIFQAGLVTENSTMQFLEEHTRIVLQQNIESLYASGVKEDDMLKTLVEAIPRICNWIARFKDPQDQKTTTVDFGSEEELKKLTITEVIDIEEMAWAPKYGLKGMIDASLRVKVNSSGSVAHEKILPLEFKTGKVSKGQSYMEHIAQVILYTLLMSDRYLKHIDSGLLYYLQTDQTQGITVRRSDVIGLIMRRNELADYILKALTIQQLPPMLQSPSLCRACRHLDVCTIYHKVHGGNKESSGLGDVFDAHVQHLTMAHSVFLRHWDLLIDLEAKETQLVKNGIWRSSSFRDDHSSGCLSSLVLETSCRPSCQNSLKDNRFIYHFVQKELPSQNTCESHGDFSSIAPSSSKNNFDHIFKRGDYVILSTESGHRPIASGVISDISHFRVSVSFPKHLRLPGSNSSSEVNDLFRHLYRIDKDKFLTSFSVMRFNLVQLFLQNERSSHLRKLIVDLEAPRFDSGCVYSQDPALSYIWSVKSLNADQRRSILKILTAKDYALILGMPGTGKTSTMVHAVMALLTRGSSILLTSYTNSAVDNLLIKLKAQGIDFLRIGRPEAVHEDVREKCFSALDVRSVQDIRLRSEQVKVVAVTCLGVTSPLLASKNFDVCIMDEAGQITLPISLGPLMCASKFVLVGDHYQLPPLVQSVEAREKGMGVSLFCRLSEAHPHAISALQSQYRMCAGIMGLSNALIYGDRLSCGSLEIASAKLKFSSLSSCSLWIKQVLDSTGSLVFINTDMLPALETKTPKTVSNLTEAYIVAEITNGLIGSGIDGNEIGIITPYNSQANLIRTAVELTSVEIHTIDKYQGRDKDCILVSFVRSSENPKNFSSSLLGDWHRINVAVTRAKKKLIMVGSRKTLSKVPLLKLLIEKVEEKSGILNVTNEVIDCKKQHKGEL